MKKLIVASAALLFYAVASKAQQNEQLISLLVQKNIISQSDADSLRADLAVKTQAQKEKQEKFPLTAGRALTLGGLLQSRYQATPGTNAFDTRRARISLKGDIAENWDYELYFELAGTPALLDGIISYKFSDYLKLSAGQLKIPFSLESLTSDSQLELIDRSQVEEALAARAKDVIGNQVGRGIGVVASGSLIKITGGYLLDYQLGIFNGNGINKTSDNNKNKDLAGRLTLHPLGNLSLSYNFYEGKAIFGTITTSQVRSRRGIDARYINGPLSLTAEYDKGTDGLTKRKGWYAQAAWFILPKKLQVAAKYDSYDPAKAAGADGSRWYTGGINYSLSSRAKLAVNYTYKHEQAPAQTLNNLLSAQMQLTF